MTYMPEDMMRHSELKKAITRNGQLDNGKINGKPVSFLLSYWDEAYSYSENISFKVPDGLLFNCKCSAKFFGISEVPSLSKE